MSKALAEEAKIYLSVVPENRYQNDLVVVQTFKASLEDARSQALTMSARGLLTQLIEIQDDKIWGLNQKIARRAAHKKQKGEP